MPTPEEVNTIHDTLDAGTREIDVILTALLLDKASDAKDAAFRATLALGQCKDALRLLGAGTPAATIPAAVAPSVERERRWIEHATDLRAKGLENMVTVAAVALTLSVTFREAVGTSTASVPWLLKASWVTFAVCIVSVIADRLVSSRRFTFHAVMGSVPSKPEKWMLASLYLLSLVAFALGIVALAAFGWANL